ncbi:hypothetical protein K432DRAFT_216396 [Lepidopterella palustris CBS 459.81]|uniref:Uncharacterized protein n=1 Tax=Lepidopterella palustris CBS 459.81 TaxID=1314670 RepID=A0A8E2EKW1_9PEZI|nr:hypothetical protein K432DRAFT_216396 [Lepidopterella palustris CBS 459.81]
MLRVRHIRTFDCFDLGISFIAIVKRGISSASFWNALSHPPLENVHELSEPIIYFSVDERPTQTPKLVDTTGGAWESQHGKRARHGRGWIFISLTAMIFGMGLALLACKPYGMGIWVHWEIGVIMGYGSIMHGTGVFFGCLGIHIFFFLSSLLFHVDIFVIRDIFFNFLLFFFIFFLRILYSMVIVSSPRTGLAAFTTLLQISVRLLRLVTYLVFVREVQVT